MPSRSFARFATVTASTKRSPAETGGKVGAMAEYIASLKCTPLYPVSPELSTQYATKATREILQTYVEGGLDIKPGDVLVVGATSYPIRAVGEWTWPPTGTDTLQLILEELKT